MCGEGPLLLLERGGGVVGLRALGLKFESPAEAEVGVLIAGKVVDCFSDDRAPFGGGSRASAFAGSVLTFGRPGLVVGVRGCGSGVWRVDGGVAVADPWSLASCEVDESLEKATLAESAQMIAWSSRSRAGEGGPDCGGVGCSAGGLVSCCFAASSLSVRPRTAADRARFRMDRRSFSLTVDGSGHFSKRRTVGAN